MVLAPLSFLGISAGRVFPLLPFGLPFPSFPMSPGSGFFSPFPPWFFFTNSVLSLDPPLTHSLHLLSPCLFPILIIPSPGRYTYEIAPVFVLMEEEVLKKLRALVGWSSGDGVFCPGM